MNRQEAGLFDHGHKALEEFKLSHTECNKVCDKLELPSLGGLFRTGPQPQPGRYRSPTPLPTPTLHYNASLNGSGESLNDAVDAFDTEQADADF